MIRGNDRMWPGYVTRSIALLLTIVVTQSFEVVAQTSRGCQFIGMSKTTGTDIDKLAGILAAASGGPTCSATPIRASTRP